MIGKDCSEGREVDKMAKNNYRKKMKMKMKMKINTF